MSQAFTGETISWTLNARGTSSSDLFEKFIRTHFQLAAVKMGFDCKFVPDNPYAVLMDSFGYQIELVNENINRNNQINTRHLEGTGEISLNGDHKPWLMLFFLQEKWNQVHAGPLISLSDQAGNDVAFGDLSDLKLLAAKCDVPWEFVRGDAEALELAIPLVKFHELSTNDSEDAFF